MTFYSRIDLSIGAVIVLGIVIALRSIPKALTHESVPVQVGLVVILVATAALLISAFFTRYEIGEGKLHIKAWPLYSLTIPIADIYRVERTRETKSSPALSLDRIKVIYKAGSVIISPRQESEFVTQLKHQNPNISWHMSQ
jgi:hypothetical protein